MSLAFPYKYIAVEGNIGAGKTSLAKILSAKFHSLLILEEFAENTFLPQFYEHPDRFAFPLEMSFLAERYQQLLQAQQEAVAHNRLLISDYIFEKSMLFASVNLKGNELDLFRKFYEMINATLQKPDLILYLKKSTAVLQKNINHRGRSYEQQIPDEYLEGITGQYELHLRERKDTRIISIHSDQLDFVNNSFHLQQMLKQVIKPIGQGFHEIDPVNN
jgi:deoxyguanosine kinase